MGSHSSNPFVANRGSGNASTQVQRCIAEASDTEAPLDMVNRRSRGIETSVGRAGNRTAETGALVEAARRALWHVGIARKENPVSAQQRKLETFRIRQGRKKLDEI